MGRPFSQRIEVLLKKASVDPAFRTAFLERRGDMAPEIGLSLEPAEAAMLRAVEREQLEAIIAMTSVPEEHRRAFLGQAAAAMLTALGIVAGRPGTAAEPDQVSVPEPPMFGGVRPDMPPSQDAPVPMAPGGIRPDMPNKSKTIEERVISVLAKELNVNELLITTNKKPLAKLSLVDDLEATPVGLVKVRKALEKEFRLKIPIAAFKKVHTAGETIDYVKKAVDKRTAETHPKQEVPAPAPDQPPAPPAPYPMAGGVRPK